MKYKLALFVAAILFYLDLAAVESPVDYVNPMTGTQSNYTFSSGNLYPAITRPWGMNCWTPQMGKAGNGWCYSYAGTYSNGEYEQKIRGLKQTHQPSPWINDYGQFSLMPVTGKKVFKEDDRASWFSHKTEVAKPHYYSVYLAEHDVVAEMSPTERACIFRFTYPKTDKSYLVIDAFDRGSYVRVIPEENKIVGYTTRNSGGVPANFKCYFVISFTQPFVSAEIFSGDKIVPEIRELEAEHVGAIVQLKTTTENIVNVRVASSFISPEQAELNLKELRNADLETIAQEGADCWNQILKRVEVDGGTEEQYRTFYTCLYRSLLFPRKFYETDAQGNIVHYSPYNGQTLPGYMYTDSGFWDTFRGLFPLLNLLFPSINKEIQEGLINAYKESGFFPEWASPGHRPCMIGNNSASILTDAFLQGIEVKEKDLLWQGVVHGANQVHPKVYSVGRTGFKEYNEIGYVPSDMKYTFSAARTLEYAYNDWCIYQLGKTLKKSEEEINIYAERSRNYKNVFLKTHNLMCGRKVNGDFNTPLNPFKWGGDFTEGNSLHYTWSVFHDIEGLINLMGGKENFTSMLDTVFALPPVFDESYYGLVIHEMREMQTINMGNYAHGNQPVQHAAYLYNYAGQPWKTQYWIHEIMRRLYSSAPDGYCGDEDNGQTSAWYVFSALGFYSVCPGSGEYVIGSPLFKKAKLQLENGKIITIQADNAGKENVYIHEMKVNGKKYDKNFLSIAQMKKGMKISFKMDHKANTDRGIAKESFPYSFTNTK